MITDSRLENVVITWNLIEKLGTNNQNKPYCNYSSSETVNVWHFVRNNITSTVMECFTIYLPFYVPVDAQAHFVLAHQPLMPQNPHKKDNQNICTTILNVIRIQWGVYVIAERFVNIPVMLNVKTYCACKVYMRIINHESTDSLSQF